MDFSVAEIVVLLPRRNSLIRTVGTSTEYGQRELAAHAAKVQKIASFRDVCPVQRSKSTYCTSPLEYCLFIILST